MTPLDTVAAASRAAPSASGPTDDARLRQACAQLEGVFLEQLMKALRDTVPEGGVIDGGAGEDIFASLLDGQLSAAAAPRFDRGLGAALYRQFRAGPAAEAAPAPTPFASVEVRRP